MSSNIATAFVNHFGATGGHIVQLAYRREILMAPENGKPHDTHKAHVYPIGARYLSSTPPTERRQKPERF